LNEKAIILEGVSRVYYLGKQKIVALNGIDLEVDEAEFVVIQGPSGAGKSTLLNIIAGLDIPTVGAVTVLGTRVDNSTEDVLSAFRCANIGFVFQQYNLISTFTAIENIEFPIEISGQSAEKATRLARILLKQVGLANRALHFPAQLSGGEQQRLAFARAVANDPPILLADEPTGNLDNTSERKVIGILNGLKHQGKTIVVATHDENILGLADRVLSLVDGRIKDAR
jgi:putative ABC transport system ATP-binding protein